MKGNLNLFIYNLFLFLLLGVCLFYSCSESKKKHLSQAELDSLRGQLTTLQIQLNEHWQAIQAQNDAEMEQFQMLIEEMSSTEVVPQDMDSLMQEYNKLVDLRFDQQSLGEANAIDQFDQAKGKFIVYMATAIENHPQNPAFPPWMEAIQAVQDQQNKLIFMRSYYDEAVRKYNQVIIDHAKHWPEIDSANQHQMLPLFSVEGESAPA